MCWCLGIKRVSVWDADSAMDNTAFPTNALASLHDTRSHCGRCSWWSNVMPSRASGNEVLGSPLATKNQASAGTQLPYRENFENYHASDCAIYSGSAGIHWMNAISNVVCPQQHCCNKPDFWCRLDSQSMPDVFSVSNRKINTYKEIMLVAQNANLKSMSSLLYSAW